MSLCKTADIKDRLKIAGTEHDTVIDQIRKGFDALADGHTGRTLTAPAAAVTEYHTGGCNLLQLRAYPVIAITSVTESWTGDFESDATVLTAGTDYRLASGGAGGVLQRLWGTWPGGFESIQVIYRGGFAEPDAVLAAGETACPEDLREAAIKQVSFEFKRRDDIGLQGVSFEGGSFQKFAPIKLLPEVEAVLNRYRRIVL